MGPPVKERAGGGDEDVSAVVRVLLQRGLSVSESSVAERTFLPYLTTAKGKETFYGLLHSYAFRLFLRDILALRDRYLPERLGPFFTPESVEEMAGQSERLGLIRRGRKGTFRFLADGVTDFGDTFEWFVAEILRRQFRAEVLWGVTIPGLACGGDFDILAVLTGRLLYLETKTSPPKHIEQKEMRAFVQRVAALSPDIAILLVDTHLRMKDKLVPLLSESLREEGVRDGEMVRLEKETFEWRGKLFLTNSKRDIGGNLSLCFGRYFRGRFFS